MPERSGTCLPSRGCEFESRWPLHAGAARRSSTTLPTLRRGFNSRHPLYDSVLWRGTAAANRRLRVRFPPGSPRSSWWPRLPPSKRRGSVRLRASAPRGLTGRERSPPKAVEPGSTPGRETFLPASGPSAESTKLGCGCSIQPGEAAGQPEMASRPHKPRQPGATPGPATAMS
jgi:hypothetical protein